MSIVVTTDLSRTYGSRRGISQVNLSIEPGEIFGFLGPNGAGKSTTIRILMGLLRASSGAAKIFGQDCWRDGAAVRANIGYVPGDVRLYSWLTLRKGLSFLAGIHGRNLQPAGLTLAERFQLEPDLPVRKMSRGNRQKVALVLALCHTPQLLILDEPTSGLDPLMQDTLMACLRERAGQGHTVMFSSHTLSEVETLCDHIAIVRNGCIVEDSTVTALKAQAPRQIVVTLRPEQDARSVHWPEFVKIMYLPGVSAEISAPSTIAMVAASQKNRVCLMELTGASAEFLKWAATQDFEDVVIGPPALEVLFRRYYDLNVEVA
jgi:ABC-2 type transport system ATP-binding protein